MVKGWEVSTEIDQPKSAKVAIDWYRSKFNSVLGEIENSFDKYRISEALMSIYKLIWDDFSSWFLEIVKPAYEQPIDADTLASTLQFFEDNLKILHPYMPFITEELWQDITERSTKEALIISNYPKMGPVNDQIIHDFEFAKEIISGIRNLRKEKNIAFKNKIDFSVKQ